MRTVYGLTCLLLFIVASEVNTFKIIVYYTNWAQYRQCNKFFPESIEPIVDKVSHINYAFAKFDTSGNVFPIEWNDCPQGTWPGCQGPNSPNSMFDRMFKLKQKNPNLKIMISIGGWSWGGTITCPTFSGMASNPTSRSNFVRQAIQFSRNFGFNGIDIDWEYPGAIDLGCSANDPENYISLISELRSAIEQDAVSNRTAAKLLLSVASPAARERISTMKLSSVVQFLDHVNVMAYDYHGSWDQKTGVNAPIRKHPTDLYPDFNINTTIQIYNQFGINKSKLVLGMPTYGRTWKVNPPNFSIGAPASGPGERGQCSGEPGFLTYYEIKQLIASGFTSSFDDTTQTPYAYSSTGSTWVSYDNEQSLNKKADLIKQHNWGGAMFWSLDLDDFSNGYPLISTVINSLNNGQPPVPIPPTPNPCGNQLCDDNESCLTCPQDCGQCNNNTICGNSLCEQGENCITCSSDCGPCQPPLNNNTWNGIASVVVSNVWNSGYCATLNITNNGEKDSNAWRVEIILPTGSEISSIWSCKQVGKNGDVTKIESLNWNGVVRVGEIYTGVGFCANKREELEVQNVNANVVFS